MGTPDFAVPCLERLVSDGENVVGVFSQPDKPKGRGHILTPPPVKECALTYNIPVFQPVKMKASQTVDALKELNPDLIIVVAYGKILQKEILIPETTEAGTLASALICFINLGMFKNIPEAQNAAVRYKKTYSVNNETSLIYEDSYKKYLKLYSAIKEVYNV